jgi:hypothetical protein
MVRFAGILTGPPLSHKGQPYSNLPHCRRFEYEHVTVLLLGHKKLEGTVRYLGIEVDDALEISESIEV